MTYRKMTVKKLGKHLSTKLLGNNQIKICMEKAYENIVIELEK